MVPQIDPVNADAQSYTSLGSTSAGGPHMLFVVGGWTCRRPKPNDSEFEDPKSWKLNSSVAITIAEN